MKNSTNTLIETNLNKLLKSYEQNKGTNFIDERRLPEVVMINQVMENLLEILFPGCSGKREITSGNQWKPPVCYWRHAQPGKM